MENFITALTSGDNALTSEHLWTEVSYIAPLIGGLCIFAFGVYIARRVLKKGQKGKGGF